MTTTNDMKQSNILLNQMKQLKITLVGEKTFHFASNQDLRELHVQVVLRIICSFLLEELK